MPLANTVVDGAQVLDAGRTETRIFFSSVTFTSSVTGNQVTVFLRHEVVTETVTEQWFALTKTAAETERDANVQPEASNETYTYDVALDVRYGGMESYRLTRTFQRVSKTTTQDLSPTPDVTFDPVAGSYTTATPLTVTLECTDADAWVFYEIGEGVVPSDPTTGSARVPANTDISVQLVDGVVTTIKAFAYSVGTEISTVSSVAYTGVAP